ncbi:MAG: 5-formyltetrahydrofolate cyclo-ligase [Pseudomonadota bacterium]|nr:5-formyltetrahydrofolate cyclo-ligase [Pseudomonadota bacterium]
MSGEEKNDLRAELKVLREELNARNPDAGETIASKFPIKLLERYGPVVAGYWPMGSEVDPRPLMAKLTQAGAHLALPYIDTNEQMSFRAWSQGDSLVKGPFGLQQPAENASAVSPTLILLPLLAFDKVGNRIGYGKGYYDRALEALRDEGRVFACGVGFHAQMLDHLPTDPHDQPLDWAITERGSVPIFMMRNFGGQGEESPDNGPGVA